MSCAGVERASSVDVINLLLALDELGYRSAVVSFELDVVNIHVNRPSWATTYQAASELIGALSGEYNTSFSGRVRIENQGEAFDFDYEDVPIPAGAGGAEAAAEPREEEADSTAGDTFVDDSNSTASSIFEPEEGAHLSGLYSSIVFGGTIGGTSL